SKTSTGRRRLAACSGERSPCDRSGLESRVAFRLRVRNFRALRRVDWRPEGVCALVGPNASGKTTLLDVPAMVGDALRHGVEAAFDAQGGPDALRTLGTADREPLELDVSLGELRWEMCLSQTADGLQAEERAFRGDEVIATRETTTGRSAERSG